MSAADKICALQNVRRFKLVSEDGWHGMTVRPDGGYVSHKDYAALADLADAQAQELEAQSVELARAKSRGDNHWETLKGIRHIAKTSGDLERIILWVDDAGSGYTALPETSLAEVCNERNAARAEADAQAQEIAKLKHVAVDLAASLAAAISLLERGGKAAKKAAPSDRMFDQMKADYHASLTRARAALGETT